MFLVFGLLSVGGCTLQPLDEKAASVPPSTGPTISIVEKGDSIELPEGDTTQDPCVLTTTQITTFLQTSCASCHGGGSPGARQGQPPFDFVLDFERLKSTRSTTVQDPGDPSLGMAFLLPGSPERSLLYVRVADGNMPPVLPFGLEQLPRPTVSDLSLLNFWISSCTGSN